ncbi:MAG TPA: ABC transporter permease subunit [Thermoplasmata archaeon]|nr:ABC transporter permease subunit [Thermoplasmata archaeon]
MRRPGADIAFLLPVLLFVGLFSIVPVVVLFGRSIDAAGGTAGILPILASASNVRAVDNSLVQGALSAVFAVAFGYPAGVFVGRYDWPGRSIFRSFLLVPFLLPSLVVVFGVLDLFGPSGLLSTTVPALAVFGSGLPAIVVANLLFNVPIVVLFTAAGAEGAFADLEETVATLGGTPARAYRDVWGPATWVGAAAGGLLTFLFSALSFAPPLLLCGPGCYTIEAQVWFLDTFGLQPAAAGVLSLAVVAIFLVPTGAYLLLVGRLRGTAGHRRAAPRRVDGRSPVTLALAAETALVLVAVAGLLAAVLLRTVAPVGGGGPGSAWTALFSAATTQKLGISAVGAVGNTLFFATVAAAIALVLGVVTGYAIARRPGRAGVLGLLLFVPLLLSPVVLAFALADFWRPLLGGESTVWALIIVSQASLALPLALQSLEIPLSGLSPAERDAARTLGATGWVAFLDADLPRVRGGLVTAGLFAFALGLGEFTATYFLVTPTFTTLPVALYDLSNTRYVPAVSDAAAGLLLLLSLGVFGVLVYGGRRVEL